MGGRLLPVSFDMASVSYTRLLEAASALKGWSAPAEIARGLACAGMELNLSRITNWATRRVPPGLAIEIAKIIGCRVDWLMGIDDGPMAGVVAIHAATDLDMLPWEMALSELIPEQRAQIYAQVIALVESNRRIRGTTKR